MLRPILKIFGHNTKLTPGIGVAGSGCRFATGSARAKNVVLPTMMKSLIIALATATVARAAAPKLMDVDVTDIRARYPNLLKVQHFSTVDVSITGSKAKLGLTTPELNEFAMNCFGQLFKGYDVKPLPAASATTAKDEYGTLNFVVETYPIGVSIELRMGTVGSAETWTTNELRVSTTAPVKDAKLLKASIVQMLAKAANTLRRTQGKAVEPLPQPPSSSPVGPRSAALPGIP